MERDLLLNIGHTKINASLSEKMVSGIQFVTQQSLMVFNVSRGCPIITANVHLVSPEMEKHVGLWLMLIIMPLKQLSKGS